jgi:ABC-type Fe3+-hydroxamate transport system substrate-binding protein
MLPSRSFSFVTFVALGAVTLIASTAASAQGYGGRYGTYADDDEYGAPMPPRPIPDYTHRGVETVVTTTRRVVTSRPADYEYGEPDDEVNVRRVIVPPPIRRVPPVDVVTTGGVPPRPYYPRYPVYKSDPVYAPAPGWQEEYITARPRVPAPSVIIEERRVETTRRILTPAPLD